MTPRQQRRLEQKLARKAAKKLGKAEACAPAASPVSTTTQPNRDYEGAEVFAPLPAAGTLSSISGAKLLANRRNAQLSQGPVTESGKQIVSQNPVRHGLTGKFQVLPDESQEDFDQMLAGFMRAEAPADREEIEFVQQMAQSMWLSSRSIRLQDRCIVAMESGTLEERKQASKDLSLYLRYMTTHERAFVRFSTELRKRRNERRKAERGFVSQKQRDAAERRREVNEIRKKEMHELRQVIANCRRERIEIQNRLADAKAERLERQSIANKKAPTLAAAA